MAGLFSIKRDDESHTITILGLKIRLVREPKLGRVSWHHYGFYEILKEYTGLSVIPRGVNAQHGWTPANAASPLDLENAPALELAWNKRFKDDWDAKSARRCEVIGSPFVIYRRMRGIEVAPEAKGTVVFPSHSLLETKSDYDIAGYCRQLKALPEEFQPITVSLHPVDIERWHMDDDFRANGFEVVSAGLDKTTPFYQQFYEILRTHRYVTSNEIGSYTFYAVEMGLPFFLLGPDATLDNRDGINPELERQLFCNLKAFEFGRKAMALFDTGPNHEIREEQQAFVHSELGLTDSISRDELRAAIINVAAKEYAAKTATNHLLRMVKLLLQHPAQASRIVFFYRFLRDCHRSQAI